TWAMTVTPVGTARAGAFRCEAKARHVLRLEPYAPGEKILPDIKVAERPQVSPDKPIVQLGVNDETLHGRIKKLPDGSYDFPQGEPWGWIDLGRVRDLEGLKSFTIVGWARAASLKTGMGGNRIAFNLNYNRAGFDLVHHADGRMRLSVNEWPDRVKNDSSPKKIRAGEWVYFAVAYDGKQTRWRFGGPRQPAALDRTTPYARGATGKGSGTLTIGNYNETLHRHGTDRQFRGQLHGIRIFGSTKGTDGALPLETIRALQTSAAPDFAASGRK
ncbi:hypothetical protein HQ560_16985, partial [bacterium]|nr:hypothetical protein [bacterium]